jgi:hypothetical protein
MAKVLFLHGLESRPGGYKAKKLEEAGHEVINPALMRESFSESVKIAQEAFDAHKPDVIVGSSFGGAVAMSLSACGVKKVLIAPAWKRFDRRLDTAVKETIVLHSEYDSIVPFKDSAELAEKTGATLVSVGTTHRMRDKEAIEALLTSI